MKAVNYIIGLVVIVFIFALGYFRDYVFVNINYELIDIYYNRTDWSLQGILAPLEKWPYARLYYFKYVLTLIFTLSYLVLACIGVKALFKDRKYVYYTCYAFGAIFLFSLVVNGFNFFGIVGEEAYHFSRTLMGFVQSPLMFMILVPTFYIAKAQQKH